MNQNYPPFPGRTAQQQSKFLIIKDNNGYRFELVIQGDTLLSGGFFPSPHLCQRAIHKVKKYVGSFLQEEMDVSGQYSFRVLDRRGHVLARSRNYLAESSKEYALRQVIWEAPAAAIEGVVDHIPVYIIGSRKME